MAGLATFLFALALSYAGTFLLLKFRTARRFVDVPNERSSHEIPKPRLGGIAIAGSFLAVCGVLLYMRPELRPHLPLLLGGAVVFATGVLDDWRSLPVAVRLLAQGLAAVIVVASGHVVREVSLPGVEPIELGVVAAPLTFLFILTSVNFYNFIDGIDGLAAGSAAIAAGFLALIAHMLGHGAVALLCLAAAGASAGFLQFNFPPSRLFMGDGGSTFLGFFLAYVAVIGSSLQPPIPFFVTILILSSLFLDAGLTLVTRALRGERVFRPHKTHYYQRLLSLGLNHKQVTVLEYALVTLLGTSAVIFFKAGGLFPAFVSLAWIVVFAALILKIRSLERGDRLFWERRTVLVIASDLVLIALAYWGAYFLRMGFRFTEAEGTATLKAFPIVLVVRSACFYCYGLYRGVWKYTSTPDVLRIIKSVTVGSAIIVTLLVLFYRFVAFPRSVIIIEYFLLIIALGGSRFASRLFHEFGKEALGGRPRRLAIIGAGDYGERVCREVRNTAGSAVSVVCYVDDDRDKSGLVLQGVPILGPIERLAQICSSHAVDAIVIGIRNPPEERLRAIVKAAREAGVPVEPAYGAAGGANSAYVAFDRMSRELARPLPAAPGAQAERFYGGKRVLVTNGGESIGPALVRELLSLGARVVVQIESPREAGRFGELGGESFSYLISGFDRESEVSRALDAAAPDIVIHCVAPARTPSLNAEEFLWRRIVRSARAIRKVMPGRPVGSFMMCCLWDGLDTSSRPAALFAVAEAALLNSADLLAAAPKVLRLPSVLTSEEVSKAASGPASRRTFDREFGLHELEAVAVCLNVAASYKGRVIAVPRPARPIRASDMVPPALGGLAPLAAGAPAEDLYATVFPTEMPRPSIVAGAREVTSPLYPVSDSLWSAVSRCLLDPGAATLSDSLDLVRSVLLEGAPRVSVR